MRLPVACGRPSTQAALGNFFLRAGAKLTVNDGKKFSNFSRRAKIEASVPMAWPSVCAPAASRADADQRVSVNLAASGGRAVDRTDA